MPPKNQVDYRRKRRAAGKDLQHGATSPEATLRYRTAHPEKVQKWVRAAGLRRTNSTVEEYDRKFAEQNGLCAICGKPEPVVGRRLSNDHDHDTGENRGLLCSLCNPGLGLFKDDPNLLLNAIAYLAKHGKVGA